MRIKTFAATAAVAFAMVAQAHAAASCSPVSTDASILSSADSTDTHPDWDGSRIGLSWSLIPTGDAAGDDGNYYIIGNLIDPRGNVVTRRVYVIDLEWECDSD